MSNEHLHVRAANGSPRRLLVVLALLALLLPACFGDGADKIKAAANDEVPEEKYPAWIQKVYPPPGSETSVTRAVQVNHNVVDAEQQVRLVIDGTDVTSYAVATSPGLLEYDIDQAQSPLDLEPGEHTAVAHLMRVTPGASEGVDSYDADVHESIESFTWTFTVL